MFIKIRTYSKATQRPEELQSPQHRYGHDEDNYAAVRIHKIFITLKGNGPCETPVEKINYRKRNSDIITKVKMNLMWKPVSQLNFKTTARDYKFSIIIRTIHIKIQISRHFTLFQEIPGIFPVFQATKKKFQAFSRFSRISRLVDTL